MFASLTPESAQSASRLTRTKTVPMDVIEEYLDSLREIFTVEVMPHCNTKQQLMRR